jgi:hypothetical protein
MTIQEAKEAKIAKEITINAKKIKIASKKIVSQIAKSQEAKK